MSNGPRQTTEPTPEERRKLIPLLHPGAPGADLERAKLAVILAAQVGGLSENQAEAWALRCQEWRAEPLPGYPEAKAYFWGEIENAAKAYGDAERRGAPERGRFLAELRRIRRILVDRMKAKQVVAWSKQLGAGPESTKAREEARKYLLNLGLELDDVVGEMTGGKGR